MMGNPLLFVIIPLAAAFLIALIAKRVKNAGIVISGLVLAVLFVLSLYFIGVVGAGKALVYNLGGWPVPLGICLVVDGLSSFMLVTVNLVALMSIIYAISYMKHYTDIWKFYSLFMLLLAGLNGVIISGDLFNLYIFLEVASIAGYVLVAYGVEPEDLEASFKYAIMGSVASVFILLSIAFIYSYTSTLNMADIAAVLSIRPKGVLIAFASVLLLVGFGLKAALVPFHSWLADAHSCAPTPVSAVLSGVFIKVLGIYTLARIFFNVLGVLTSGMLFALMVLGALSMVIGGLMAIIQNDTKRMFAYSSISQIGYIILALGIATPLALLGGLFHLFNHAIFKSLLFLDAGAIEYATGTRSLNKLGGLNKKLPVTGFAGLIGSMSISGVPPFGGFWSKLIIIIAAVQAGYIGMAIIAAGVSIITLAYYLKFQNFAFFGKAHKDLIGIKEVPFTMKLAMLILAGICIVAGLLLLPCCKAFLQPAVDVLIAGAAYKDAILGVIK